MAFLKQQSYETKMRMQDITEVIQKLEESKVDLGQNSSQEDDIYSEKMVKKIQDQGNIELIELRQTTAIVQCPSCWKHVTDGLINCDCGCFFFFFQNFTIRKRRHHGTIPNTMQTTTERCHFVKGTKKWSTTLANIAQASQRGIEGNHQEWGQARNRVDDNSQKMK